MESGDGVRDVYLREYYTCMHVFHYIIIYKIVLAYIVCDGADRATERATDSSQRTINSIYGCFYACMLCVVRRILRVKEDRSHNPKDC